MSRADSIAEMLAVTTSTIPSARPRLEVSVHINKKVEWFADEQAAWWRDLQSSGHPVNVSYRNTRSEVMKALADGDTADQILNVFCYVKRPISAIR
jgi:hypothetical protein